MHFEWSNKKRIIIFFIIILCASLFSERYSASAVSFSSVDVPNNELVVGDKFEAIAYLDNWENASKISLVVDGQVVQTCDPQKSCGVSFDILPTDIGEHNYYFLLTDVKGYSKKSGGKFFVKTDVPEVNNLKINSDKILVGGYLYAKLDAKSVSPIVSSKLFIDGNLVKNCSNEIPCIASVGPFYPGDAGEHTYVFEVINEKGKTVLPGGFFSVVKNDQDNKAKGSGEAKNDVSSPELVDLKIDKKNNDDGSKEVSIDVLSKDEKGIVSTVGYVDGSYVGGCDQGASCAVSIPASSISGDGLHIYKVVVVNVDGKKVEVEGVINGGSDSSSNSADIKQETKETDNTATDNTTKNTTSSKQTYPEVDYIVTQNEKFAVGETFNAKILVKDDLGIKSILGYIDDKLVSTCTGIVVCPIKKGPLTEADLGIHSFSFLVENTSGNKIEKSATFLVYKATTAIVPSSDDQKKSEPNANIPTKDVQVAQPTTTNDIKNQGQPIWIDTDGGINESILGKCVSNVIGAPYQKYLQDYCIDKNHLNEYYLDSKADKCLSKKITCGGVCYEGECYAAGTRPAPNYTPPTTTTLTPREAPVYTPPATTADNNQGQPLWIDTDNGLDEYTLGKCLSNVVGAPYQKYLQDYCVDKNNLMEYYVDSKADKCLSKQITCESVCYEGICYHAGTRPGASYTPTTR